MTLSIVDIRAGGPRGKRGCETESGSENGRPGDARTGRSAPRLDVVTIGRSSVDLYGKQIGSRLEDVSSFAKSVGGCPANIAIGAARLGLKCGGRSPASAPSRWAASSSSSSTREGVATDRRQASTRSG